KGSNNQSNETPINNHVKSTPDMIASPPVRGMIWLCKERSFGLSRASDLNLELSNTNNPNKVSRKLKMLSTMFIPYLAGLKKPARCYLQTFFHRIWRSPV